MMLYLFAAGVLSVLWLVFALWMSSDSLPRVFQEFESTDKRRGQDLRVIATLTTSPLRIFKMRDMLRSITDQSRPPDLVIINLPPRFERTGEEYTIPDWLNREAFPTVIVHRCDRDLGPITKLVPTLNVVSSHVDYLWVVDDDQLYHPRELEFLLDQAATREGVLCLTGLQRRGTDDKVSFTEAKFQEGKVDVFEAYAGVLIPVSTIHMGTFMPYVERAIQDPDCRTSDDLITSTYLERRGVLVQKVFGPSVNIDEHWSSRRVLQYGRSEDALSRQQTSTLDRYIAAYPKLLAMM